MPGRPRVVIASPFGAECETLASWLSSEGFDPIRAATAVDAAAEVHARPFDLLIADASFAFRDGLDAAARKRRRNPRTPTIVIGDSKAEQAQADQKDAMYLARPADRPTLVCTVSMALMDERPTRRSLRKPVNRVPAVVDGVASYIIDISPEGLRLEIPRDRRSSPAPYFSVRVPLLGVALIVQRMWASSRPGSKDDVGWYGGALSRNSMRAETAWRHFVAASPGSRLVRLVRES